MISDGDLIALTADGVGLVLDASGGRLPTVVHWGAVLGPMTAVLDACAMLAYLVKHLLVSAVSPLPHGILSLYNG